MLRTVDAETKNAAEIRTGAGGFDPDDREVETALKRDRQFRQGMRDFVAAAVERVGPFDEGDGREFFIVAGDDQRIAADDLETLEACRLMLPLYQAALEYNTLTGAQRGNFGASPRSTSETQTTTATPAANGIASGKDATGALSLRAS